MTTTVIPSAARNLALSVILSAAKNRVARDLAPTVILSAAKNLAAQPRHGHSERSEESRGGEPRSTESPARRAVLALVLGILLSLLPWMPISAASASGLADELPPAASVEGLVGHPQEHNLSCESRSATDLAAFWGLTFTEDDFFQRLPKSDNPNRGFLGDVDLPPGSMPPAGYGVYVEPVAATLRSFGLGAQARNEWTLDGLRAELAARRPAIVWATYDMQLPGVQTWVSSDGATSTVVQWQHTFVATGYDEGGLYLVDAYDGGTKYFFYDAFIPAWDQLGRMAVTVGGPFVQPRAWKATDEEGRRCLVVDDRWRVGPE